MEVSVFEEPQLTQRVRVDADGRIALSLLGEIAVSGMVPADAGNLIAEKYRSARLLNRPRVSVLVLEYATQSTVILGQVVHPGAILLYAPRGVLDVLSMVGGFTDIADRHVTIQRHSGATETVYLPNGAGAMLEQSSVQVNPGDSVIVPRAGIVYVLGDVARPGGYVMQNDAGMTLLQAIASASGINKTAAESQTRLIRTLSNGDFQDLKVGLKRIERGKEADIPLQANDVVYVPFSLAQERHAGRAGHSFSHGSGRHLHPPLIPVSDMMRSPVLP